MTKVRITLFDEAEVHVPTLQPAGSMLCPKCWHSVPVNGNQLHGAELVNCFCHYHPERHCQCDAGFYLVDTKIQKSLGFANANARYV